MAESSYANLLRRAARWLEASTVGTAGHVTTQTPFGIHSASTEEFVAGSAAGASSCGRVRELAEAWRWPHFLRAVYTVLGHSDREFTVHGWTFFSLDDIAQRRETYAANQRLCDVAARYEGMGHYVVLSVDTGTGKMLQRYDGGSNGYERDATFRFITSVDLGDLDEAYFEAWNPRLPVHRDILSAHKPRYRSAHTTSATS